MSDDPIAESDIAPVKDKRSDEDAHDRMMRRFDSVSMPQQELRQKSIEARAFVIRPGAQWEGSVFEDADTPKPEIDRITQNLEKKEQDYRQNRLSVNFLPGEGGDKETAGTLNDMFRADAHIFKSQQGWDNAFREGMKGGMGAWRLTTDRADPYDPDNDSQRINPGIIIPDADQSVYFDGASTLYDASDARWAFVVVAMPAKDFEDRFPDASPASFDTISKDWGWQWQWFQPDIVQIAEYYEVEDVTDKLLIFTQKESGEEQRFFESELEDGEAKNLNDLGWESTSRDWKRRRVHKYILSGMEILKDCGYIAGDQIPIVPFYARYDWLNSMPWWRGGVQKKMDAQRTLNTSVARLAEIDSLAPYEVPIVADEQMTPAISQEWAEGNLRRHPYRRLLPLRNNDGDVISAGPIGNISPPQVPATLAAQLQFAVQILSDDDDTADQVKANVSADAMEMAANRVDERSAIDLDNLAISMARCGEIYRGMAREIYYEPGRKIDTRTLDGNMGQATLMDLTRDPDGTFRMRNDLTRGKYNVEASVQESTATKRQKAMRQGLELGQAFMQAQSPQDALAAYYTAAENMDGEGIDDLIAFYRQRSIAIGATKPTPEEQKQIEAAQAQQGNQPDPQALALQASLAESQSKAALNQASAQQKQADAQLKVAQADTLEKAPAAPTGLSTPANDADVVDKIAGANLKQAQAQHLQEQMRHQRIRTGADLQQQAHDQDMARRQQDFAERQASQGASE